MVEICLTQTESHGTKKGFYGLLEAGKGGRNCDAIIQNNQDHYEKTSAIGYIVISNVIMAVKSKSTSFLVPRVPIN